MADSTSIKQLQAALASAKALVASLEAALVQAEQPQADPALGLDAAATACGLSPHTLRSWCKSGRLKCSRGPRGAYLVRLSDIDEAIEVEPSTPSTPRRRAQPVDADAWEREQEREFRLLAGGQERL